MRPPFNRRLYLFVFSSFAALFLTACGDDDGAGSDLPTPQVTVAAFQPQDITVREEYAGRVRGLREVEVRSRVGGIVLERLYREGQEVEEGAPLFQIDPVPYRIALQQARAERDNARATFSKAKRDWERVSSLFDRNVISTSDRDNAQSALELAEAGIALTEAGVAAAELNLDWTTVIAPVAGVTGLENLSEGSLVSEGELLTSVTQLDPVYVRFSLPENDAATLRAGRRADAEVSVSLRLSDGDEYAHPGRLDFTDSTVDGRTGSVAARATFPNPEGRLTSGQFVRLRTPLQELTDVILIPQKAVVQGAQGPQVFAVSNSDQAKARPVRLGPVIDGKQVILDGIDRDERVVINGLVSLRPGMPVNAHTAAMDGES